MTIFVSIDSSSSAQCAAVRNEIDSQGGAYDLDPLQILLYEESMDYEFDAEVALCVLQTRHALAGKIV